MRVTADVASSRVHRGWEQLLTAGLAGAAVAPLVAAALGWPVVVAFGLPPIALVAALALGLAGDACIHRLRRHPWREVLEDAVGIALFAVLGALTVRHRANAFYTPIELVEAMSVLLALHLAARALGLALAVTVEGARPPHARWPAAAGTADRLMRLSTLLLIAFWVLAWVPYREAAGISLIALGALQGLVVLLRLPDALVSSEARDALGSRRLRRGRRDGHRRRRPPPWLRRRAWRGSLRAHSAAVVGALLRRGRSAARRLRARGGGPARRALPMLRRPGER